MQNYYVTTTLPYVNASPHMGHALHFVQWDAVARYLRQSHGDDRVFFNVGTDEHGLKIYEKAQAKGMDVRDFIEQNVQTFYRFCEDFGISYDNFYQTSKDYHVPVAQAIRKACQSHIYKKSYEGLYCVGCEAFKTDKDLIPDPNNPGIKICPDHLVPPIVHAETNYFFALSKQKEKILTHLDENPDFVQPASKQHELRNFLENLQDISISRLRKNLPRWVAVPDDDEQVMYVWFDALSNYVGAVWYPHDMDRFGDRRHCIQLSWPDNLRFQWAIFQGMLAWAGLPFSQKLLVHGTVLWPDGNKMSKTIGNTVDPYVQFEKYGASAVRLYLLAWIPTFADAAYKEEDLIALYNSRMADAYGNLLNRVLKLAAKKDVDLESGSYDQDVVAEMQAQQKEATDLFDRYELHDASMVIHKIVLAANKYIDEKKPRDKTLTPEQVSTVLCTLYRVLQIVTELYHPIVPEIAQKASEMLTSKEASILCQKIESE